MLQKLKNFNSLITFYNFKKTVTTFTKKKVNKIVKKKKIFNRPRTKQYKKFLKLRPKYFPPQFKRPFLVKKAKVAFFDISKKRRRNIFESKRKAKRKLFSLLKVFIKRNPYVLIRKNYKALFTQVFKDKIVTPLFLDFLHLAYFKLNINNIYRPRNITKLDSYAKRMYRFTLSNYKRFKLSSYQYLFVLMKKKTHYQKIFELYNNKNFYNRQLHQLYYFQKVKKAEFNNFLDCPQYLHPEMGYLEFNKYDALKFHEYSYIQQVLEFYYPVTEIHFKETHIHGKPMKTKLPRRV